MKKTTQGKKGKIKVSENLEFISRIVEKMEKSLPNILSQNFWKKKISIQDKVYYIREIANQSNQFWRKVREEYPELEGKKLNIISEGYLEYEDK